MLGFLVWTPNTKNCSEREKKPLGKEVIVEPSGSLTGPEGHDGTYVPFLPVYITVLQKQEK